MKNEEKERYQLEALTAWKKNDYKGTLQLCTGFGKTRTGIIAGVSLTRQRLAKVGLNDFKILILTPREVIRDVVWVNEFKKWGYEEYLKNNTTIACIQTAYKWEDTKWDLVICDEFHNMTSDEYGKFFQNNKFDKLLCLSAHIPLDMKPFVDKYAPIVYTITLRKAKELGIVSDYIIYSIATKFTEDEQIIYNQHDDIVKKGWINNAPYERQLLYVKKSIDRRKNIIYDAENKLKLVKDISNLFPKRKGIIFSISIDNLDKIAELLPTSRAYHSAKTKAEKFEAMNLFELNKINRLISEKALKEGIHVEGTSLVLISNRNSKIKDFIQTTGRCLAFEEDKLAIIILIYIENSKDADWMKEAYKGNSIIQITFEDLKALYEDRER